MANTSFNQISTLLNAIHDQATGKSSLAATNTSEFMSIATETLDSGYDKIFNAISKVLTRTIFSTRAYTGKFASMQVDSAKWGSMVRKLNIIDKPLHDDPSYDLVDGASVDPWVINLPQPLQLNFYGSNLFRDWITILMDQVDQAFEGVDQFGSFMGMVMQNMTDKITQYKENVARATVANYIGAVYQFGGSEQKIHLLTEYNTMTGLATPLTAQTCFQPDNFRPFQQFIYARINELSEMMTERSQLFHFNITGKPLMRHTPKAMQNVYLFTPAKYRAVAMADANTFNENLVGFAANENVNFWQSIESPGSINVKPAYLDVSDGTVKTYNTGVSLSGTVYGVIFDRETMGTTTINERVLSSGINSTGAYSNLNYTFNERYWTDFTENGAILLLD